MRTTPINARLAVGFFGAALLGVAAAHAEGSGASANAEALPLPVFPSSPAFQALDANPTTIMRPTSVRDFGADLATTVDADGKLKTGIALEAAPLWLGFARDTTLREWRDNALRRFYGNVTVSFATVAKPGNEGLTRIAQGIKYIVFDDADPRWDAKLEECIIEALKPTTGTPPPTIGEAKKKGITIEDNAKLAQCKSEHEQRAKSGASLAFAGAITEQTGATASQAALKSLLGWVSYSMALGAHDETASVSDCKQTCKQQYGAWGQLIFSGRVSRDVVLNVDEFSAGARLRIGTPYAGLSLDAAWVPRYDHSWMGNTVILGSLIEARLADATWLVVNFGGKAGSDAEGAKLFTDVSLKLGFGAGSSVSLYKPP